MADKIIVGSSSVTPSSGHRGVSMTAELEDYFRKQYPEYWNEQFYLTDGIYGYTKKVPIKSTYMAIGYKITRASNNSYSLGTTWGREGADNSINEDYSIAVGGSERAGERITGKVVVRRFISSFHFSEDFLYKAANGDTEWDVLADILADRELIQKHSLKRRIYLGKDGLITSIAKAVVGRDNDTAGTLTAIGSTAVDILYKVDDTVTHAGLIGGSGLPRNPVAAITVGSTAAAGATVPMISVTVENDAYFAEGEKYFFRSAGTSGIIAGASGTVAYGGFNVTLWQKDYTNPAQPLLVFMVHADEAYNEAGDKAALVVGTSGILVSAISSALPGIYSVQLERGSTGSIGTAIQPEYEGLRDLLFTQNNVVSGINRNVYKQFNCTISDLQVSGANRILTAEALQKHMNILARRNPELVNTKVISASPEALTAVETSMLQLHQYAHDPAQNGVVNVGFKAVKFYEHDLLKDDFAEHGKAYIVAKEELGEAVFRDWEWITGGAEGRMGFLDRIPQTGMYEGFMVREANTFFEKFNVHSGFKNVAESLSAERFSGLANQ